MSNADVLKRSKKVFATIKQQHIMPLLWEMAHTLLEDALSMRSGWGGFTGNLPTSYAAAVWDFSGNLFGDIIFAEDVDGHYSIASVRREKVGEGKTVHLENPWEGDERTVTGDVPIKFPWGADLAEWFLTNYHPHYKPCIVICTGAEYSKIVEDEYGNVLSASADPAFVKRIGDKIFAVKEHHL